jgi:RsiW-degrading membrane proteinase PrsW (M82 family)
MVPMVYQAYPGGPQQVYYVPAAQGAHAHPGGGVMAGLQSKIRALASTDQLEGFSLKELFNETFKKRGADAVEDYLSAGSSRTTPPLELVDTNWPKPWMFFRVLAGLAIAYAVVYALFLYTQNEKVMITIIVLATFAAPVATLMLIWEMNTPRNVSIATVLYQFVVAGGISVVVITLWYMIPFFGNLPGIVEESSKLLAVILITYGARGSRYPYQLNGILFGATVGAAYACSETLGYGLDAVLEFINGGGLQQAIAANPQGVSLAVVLDAILKPVISALNLRGILSPFCHVVWTAIAAGAFWRVKGDRPANVSMLLDGRFLRAFAIPVLLHSLWDIQVEFPNLFNPQTQAQANTDGYIIDGIMAFCGVVAWYVLFTMIQQGLHQVRDMQKAQLQHTVQQVEATMALGTMRPPLSPAPAA